MFSGDSHAGAPRGDGATNEVVEPASKALPRAGVEISTRELRDLGCGRALGRYTLLRRLAAGGMAEVYVARSRGISGFEKKVAIKKILPQHAHNERFIDMLVDEAKITVSLTHPNIAQVYELGLEGDDQYFIVMEYVEGRPLNRLMQRVDERGLMTIPVEHAAHVMAEVTKGLDHAHKQKDQRGQPLMIVHRDVSPQNVLISYAGDVKLIDFGIARAEGRAAQTSQGVIKGKLRYLAPEIAAGDEPDHRADVFCCGIVLFEMLTGEAMFAPKSDLEAIEMATQARVRSPRSRNPKVPQDLDDIVMKALRRDRNERYGSAKELFAELRRFLNQHYPAYVGDELGDFIQHMFAPEMAEDHKLDDLAERVAAESFDEPADEPTVAGARDELIRAAQQKRGYRQLVTRYNIGSSPRNEVRLAGADGGHSMGIVLDDGSARPPIQAQARDTFSKFPGTMPPQNPAGYIGEAPEVLQAYEGPALLTGHPDSFRSDGHSVLPTVRGPAPDPEQTLDPSNELVGGLAQEISEGAADPSDVAQPALPPRATTRTAHIDPGPSAQLITASLRPETPLPVPVALRGRSRALSVRMPERSWRGWVVGFLGLSVLALIVGLAIGRRREPPIPIPARNEAPAAQEPITLEPIRLDPPELEASGPIQAAGAADEPEPEEEEEDRRPRAGEDRDRRDPVRLGSGTLFVNSRPMSTVIINGKKRGTTPVSVKLRAGKYKVMLVGPEDERFTYVKQVYTGKRTELVHRWK